MSKKEKKPSSPAEKKADKEKTCQYFETEKKGGNKKIFTCGEDEIKTETKEQRDRENKILRNLFIGIISLIVLIIFIVLLLNYAKSFEYEGVKFKIVEEGNLIFYKTSFPLYSELTGKHTADYNFYIRNDPRKLAEEVQFKGILFLLENFVINSTESFHCNGDGIIAGANMIIPLQVLNANIIKNENMSCDDKGEYIFVSIESGEKTEIIQTGVTCYSIKVADCEILKATERFMLEIFIEFNKHAQK
ncbi:MAG: hypothetical protein ABH804_00475 [archaeon]